MTGQLVLVGADVGASLGAAVGASLGAIVGASLGAAVGASLGALDGVYDGALVGVLVGCWVGGLIPILIPGLTPVDDADIDADPPDLDMPRRKMLVPSAGVASARTILITVVDSLIILTNSVRGRLL